MTSIIEYDNKALINFYAENGLEFDETKGYFGTDIKSFALLKNDKVIGAFSISIYKRKSFIEAIAIDKEYRNKGYGKLLIEKAIEKLEKPIYVISKANDFFEKNGFVFDNADLIDDECKKCNEYNITCFPEVLVYK